MISKIYQFLIISILGMRCEGWEVNHKQLKRYVYENATKKWLSFVEKFVFLSVEKNIANKATAINRSNYHTTVCIFI